MNNKPILQRAFARDTFRDLRIIDMHCHMGLFHNYYFPRAEIDEMVHDADLVGIERLCIAPHAALEYDHKLGNRQAYDAVMKYPGRVWAMLSLNPNRPDDIDGLFDQYYGLENFIGVKVHPAWHEYPLNGPNYQRIFEKVIELGGFVLTHTAQKRSECNAAACEDVLKHFPKLKLILAHAMIIRDGVLKAIKLANTYENCYLDTSGFEVSDISIEYIMGHTDNSKVLFGSDMPYHDCRGGISRILFADLSDEIKLKILSGNYTQLLKACKKGE